MPATESTWRDTKLMHRIFAVTGVVLTIATVVMFYKDHARSWKSYQVTVNNIDLKMNRMRQQQFDTTDAVLEHERLAAELAQVRARAVDPALIDRFQADAKDLNAALTAISRHYEFSPIAVDYERIDSAAKALVPLAQDAQKKRAAADAAIQASQAAATNPQMSAEERGKLQEAAQSADAEASQAESKAADARQALTGYLGRIVGDARNREDKALGLRKFKSADIDAAKANVDIAIRDHAPPDVLKSREDRVRELVGEQGDSSSGRNTLTALTEVYQTISAGRKSLESTLKAANAEVEAARKAYEDSLADLERLRTAYSDRQEAYVDFAWGVVPLPGKKVLTLPILDAFNSPRKIENLWSDGLLQDFSHARVRRFDRCTTCHQSMQKSMPGQPTSPAYVKSKELEFLIVPPSKDAPPQPRLDKFGQPQPLTLEDWLGIRLAEEGLVVRDDATVELVLPNSPAARAEIVGDPPATTTGMELRAAMAAVVDPPASSEELFPTLPGLMLGDVITSISGNPLLGGDRGPKRVAAMLLTMAEDGEPIRLTVQRGLPNPYISHPRLDLYVSDSSPHRMQLFACTICHEGQGSATDFKWASHTPNNPIEAGKWTEEYGWFDNHHWIFPMFPKRFAESSCLKCHHEVVELEPSERFPEAPAPKVTHGYHLIRKYGCYGCHEINGFDGPTRRVGPDLRSEPNYFAVAQQIEAELNRFQRETLADQETVDAWREPLSSLLESVTNRPESKALRDELRESIEDRLPASAADRSPLEKAMAGYANMLKDVEAPGSLRRPGPSLRYLAQKVDAIFLYDWINNPRHFRPNTRMPRFFGLWDHLKSANGEMLDHAAPELEPIEILGMIEYFASYSLDQKFEFEQRPTGIDNWTDEEKIARGKQQFQTRGCLACHTHADFTDVAKYRPDAEIVQGPDLTGVGSKFSRERNENGPDWLYSWIKNPTRYHVRTLMPNLYLDPEVLPGDPNSTEDDKWFDPADDIATYLLADKKSDWQPVPAAELAVKPLDKAGSEALKDLMLEYLNETFYRDAAEDYFVNGIPPALEGELKGAEKDLIVAEGKKLTDAQRLKYIGRKTIFKYGCFGCHDIPGFEDAKPIGTGLADWGRKDPSRLAFEHITHYIDRGHGHANHSSSHGEAIHAPADEEAMYKDPVIGNAGEMDAGEEIVAATNDAPGQASTSQTASQLSADFYNQALHAGNRIGFIYQKLKEPRSYDYDKIENKRYNERLRMPEFPFSLEEREAVITFVLGLVADPPREKYVFQPDPRRAALMAGQQILEKYNCGGCHILQAEQWSVSYAPGEFGEQNRGKTYPFLIPHFSPKELEAASKPDHRGRLHSILTGLPTLSKNDGLPILFDLDGLALEDDAEYSSSEIRSAIDLFRPTILDGQGYMTGQAPISLPSSQIDKRSPTSGGTLTKYLLPVVTQLERQVNPNASGSEAYGWLPPPLMHEGAKVQTAWLHDFLLEPYPIRPAVFLRMPKFNMSSDEASILVNYFAAKDGVQYPYTFSDTRQSSRLESQEDAYVRELHKAGAIEELPPVGSTQRFDDAMRIVTNGNYCVKCHLVADFAPSGSNRAKAPNLADVYRRLRPDYLRDWIANPKTILPYTSMPVNIPYDADAPNLGGVSQDLYHGTSVEQVEGLVDLLMNYDQYTRGSRRIADMVTPATPMTEPGAAEPATSEPGAADKAATEPSASASPGGSSAPDNP